MVKIILILVPFIIFVSCGTTTSVSNEIEKPILITHRGGMITYPENSLVSFENVMNFTKYIEMDIHFSKDNIPIVIHDKSLDRTTNCKGLVSEKNWSQLKLCKLRNKLDWNYSKYTLSTFNDILNSKLLKKAILIVEIKESNRDAIDRLMNLVIERDNIVIQSFDSEILQYIYNHYSLENLYLISNKLPKEKLDFIKGLILNAENISKNIKEENENLDIYIYTVDKDDEFKKYLNYDIDGIITNDARFFKKYYTKGN